MKSKLVMGILLTLLFIGVLTLAFNIQPVKADSETIYVDDDNTAGPWDGTPEHPYQNITSALEHASINDTIYVYNGTYYENVAVNKALSLVGENRDTIVDGNGTGTVFTITEDNVNITGFTIQKSGGIYGLDAGIYLDHVDHCNITKNNIADNYHGIRVSASNYNIISGNNVTNNQWGIDLRESSNNTVSGNTVLSTGLNGINLELSSNNTIIGNTLSSNSNGTYFWHSNDNIFSDNIVSGKGWYSGGICLLHSNNNFFSGNIVSHTWYGIIFEISDNNTALDNTVSNSTWGIMLRCSGDNNTIFHNNFINNTNQAIVCNYLGQHTCFNNTWDDDYPSGGNYWSNYTGVDEYNGPNQDQPGSDGIGDTPHVIDDNNQDNYPLMNPWIPTETIIEVKGVPHPVTIESNTTIDQITSTESTLRFRSSGPTGKKGHILLIFPMVNTTEIEVFIDGERNTPVINTNGTHYFIYFEFTLSTHTITIQFGPTPVGGIYIPVNKLELLAPYIGLTILLAVAVMTVGYVKKRKRHTEINC